MSTILLVDDEVELLELYSDLLESMGHDVLRAGDGLEALEVARRRRPDLVVTDRMMPRMNGVELCGALVQEEALRGLPIIMHSSSGNPHAPGVLAFLPKSGDLDQFEQVVTRTLASVRRKSQAACPPALGPPATARPAVPAALARMPVSSASGRWAAETAWGRLSP
ncbi:response regulator [Corallococcus macrosporus]|uniref:Response regulator n=1 Tax=Corallococcus macrosporus TaxID=35 RepID=A0ABS3DJN4_9BACT|nr:response regulator [Corallococcus macrosporus]MBN8231517.1 response regulator [Corallococcus macrosporus]